MAEDPDLERRRRLEDRIAAARQKREGGKSAAHRAGEKYTAASLGWRMVIELVTGMVMGFGIGYGLDALFGTLPIFLVLFTLLGFGAGIRVMMETARSAQRQDRTGADAREDEDGA